MVTPSSSVHADGGPPADRPGWQRSEVPMRLVRHEVKIVIFAVLAFLVLASILAVIVWGGELFIIAGPVLFAYILLLGWPAWFAALEDDIESEAHRLEGPKPEPQGDAG